MQAAPKLTIEDTRKRSAPLEALQGYDQVYPVYAESSKRRKISPASTEEISDYDYYSLKSFSEAAQALSKAHQELADEQARTAKASADLEELKNGFEDQKTEATKKYDADMQSARHVATQLQQALQDERQRTQAAQQQIENLKAQAIARMDEMQRTHQAVIERAGAEASQLKNALANQEALRQRAHQGLVERDEQAKQASAQHASELSQARHKARIAREERDNALARANALDTSRPDADMEDVSSPDPAQVVREEADARIAGLCGDLHAKETKIREQAKRILELEALVASPGGVVPPRQQHLASIPSPPEETTASRTLATDIGGSPRPGFPKRGATNHLSKVLQDSLPKSRSGGVGTAGISKTGSGAKTRGTGAKTSGTGVRGPDSAVGRAEVSKEQKSSILDSHLKNGSVNKIFNQTKLEKDPIDRYENLFYGKGFDRFETDKIPIEYTGETELDIYIPGEVELGHQLWTDCGDVQYFADRGPQRRPIRIAIYEFDLDYDETYSEEDEAQASYTLPMFKDLNKNEEEKQQYAQACIIARLPETQAEAARSCLSSTELQAFEQRMFNGPKPVGLCHEELEYPKMFKKIVKYLRSNWRFRDAAKRWAAGDEAEFPDEPSCWPPNFKSLKSCMTTAYKTEEAYENSIEDRYTSDCTRSDQEMSKLSANLSFWSKPATVNDIVGGAGKVALNTSKKTRLPNEGLKDMFGALK